MSLPLTFSCSSKSRLFLSFLVLPFWCLLTWVVLDKFQKLLRETRSKTGYTERKKILDLVICVSLCLFYIVVVSSGIDFLIVNQRIGSVNHVLILCHVGCNQYTHTHIQLLYGWMNFVRDNPGKPVREETFTHLHLSWSSIVFYLLYPAAFIAAFCVLNHILIVMSVLTIHHLLCNIWFDWLPIVHQQSTAPH